MSRYIEKDALLEIFKALKWDASCSIVEDMQTADVRENVHGEWIADFFSWICSNCGCTVEDKKPTWNYCPNCGADMRGAE